MSAIEAYNTSRIYKLARDRATSMGATGNRLLSPDLCAPSLNTANLARLAVLIVDDSRNMRVLLRTILKGLGVRETHEAADGAQAFAILREEAIDLAIVDLHMQPMDGLELLQLVRRAEGNMNPYVPMIMITGDTKRATVAVARDSGVSAFLAKPLTAQALGRRMEFLLKDRRRFIRAAGYAGPDRRFRAADESGMRRRDADREVVEL